MLFYLDFANDTVLSYFIFFMLIIHLRFLIPAAIAQIINPIAEHVISIKTSNKEAKAKIYSVLMEAKISKFPKQF